MSTTINPILSDYQIIDYCNLNKNNPNCSCVIPPNNISAIAKNFYQPYFCWYSPCFDSTTLKTNYILNEQAQCNSTNCQIDISNISIDAQNNISISNNCATSLSKTVYINALDYTFKPLDIPLVDTRFFLLIIGLILAII
jgi:hypothetical protein